jgi:hypothetical protein
VAFSPVYSAAFIQYTHDEPNAQFEVPANFTAVIRQISIIQDIGAYEANVFIQDSIEAEGLAIFTATDVGALTQLQQEGRWVCPAGGFITLGLSSVGDTPSAYVGGYLLRNALV